MTCQQDGLGDGLDRGISAASVAGFGTRGSVANARADGGGESTRYDATTTVSHLILYFVGVAVRTGW
ncbi:hypothetical protein [Haladaptatus salinisoli]|uniref:hypothetical protein n=1 Tax=Haladaptatus salinisoli TaxID=2884876 RepID=UPI001D09C334|nr:hypothetical protein [Haladaptatus salinisoli]